MTIGDLKTLLAKYPDKMAVLTRRFSDTQDLDESDIRTIVVVPQQGGTYYRHVYSERDPAYSITDTRLAPRSVLYIEGN